MDEAIRQMLNEAIGEPTAEAVGESRRRVDAWFAQAAPRIVWDEWPSPLGPLYVAATRQGVCSVEFGVSRDGFLAGLDPLARAERNPAALSGVIQQLQTYFERPASPFDLPLDLGGVTPFQRAALQLIRQIPAGTVWTYKQVAEQLDRPRASRAVGQAMARNPLPIIIPCHRVVGAGGALTGYGGGGGIATKRRLLQMEGAL